jgi:hypothetical protein
MQNVNRVDEEGEVLLPEPAVDPNAGAQDTSSADTATE